MTAPPLPVWRSLLFVALTARRFVDGADDALQPIPLRPVSGGGD
jgi:hypothetical protein